MDILDGHQIISLHALTGLDNTATMRIQAAMKNTKVIFLIDSGSSNNFIDIRVVKKLGLDLSEIKGIELMVANGEKLKVTYMCKGVSWSV